MGCLYEAWAQILQGFTKSEIKQMLKISAVYLYKQKRFIPKKKYELSNTLQIFTTNYDQIATYGCTTTAIHWL